MMMKGFGWLSGVEFGVVLNIPIGTPTVPFAWGAVLSPRAQKMFS